MPRKEFESFTRLDASDVNTYLMDQSVMTFGGTAARGSAIPTPVEGMVTYLEDSNSFEYWDSAEWDSLVPPSSSGNFVINGAMQVAQRGTATTGVTTSGYYTADRWRLSLSTQGTWTQSVENDAPTGSGFAKSVKMLCTTADASPGSGDVVLLAHRFEGQNLQSILKGSSSAKPLTISFWVKSNVTNTYIVELQDFDNSRSVSASYSVSASGTWEKKILTFPADLTGAFHNDNDVSLILSFYLGAGSDLTSGTLQTTWASTVNTNRAVGQINLAAATNNYWQITGVQLELGNVASDFDFQDIQGELAACQRYYQRLGNNGRGSGFNLTTTVADATFPFRVTMRANPSGLDQSGTAGHYRIYHANTNTVCSAVPTFTDAGTDSITIRFTVASGLTTGQGCDARVQDASGFLGWSAEL
jgi:hypothetical protein